MDAIEILGSLLGGKRSGSGRAGGVLKDIFGGSQESEAPAASRRSGQSTDGRLGSSVDSSAASVDDLEDLLHVAVQRSSNPTRQTTQPAPQPVPTPQRTPPMDRHTQPKVNSPFGQSKPTRAEVPTPPADENEQAIILLQAMIEAAKSDGELSQEEQQHIIEQMGGASQEAIQFLKAELAKRIDVRDFAWSVPLGLEQQVFAVSVMSIDLDTEEEAEYLRLLAHGLRLPVDVCRKILQRYRAPDIFA